MSWKLRAAISALLLAPQAAFPLGLGDIRLNSALNEPLSAEIELVAPTAEELGSLSATLASRELFQRLGIDRAPFLDTVHFEVGRSRRADPRRRTADAACPRSCGARPSCPATPDTRGGARRSARRRRDAVVL
jgi:Tfp pilus assembly protein FimV